MSATDRQNRLLVAEDWKTIYQSFRNADFQSYDFDNLRRTMIEYLRTNYPEDFNDYIESSEYLALIDLVAFLGQNLSFRIDLNARENFLELAERRESVLRLARLLNYNPRRNQSANGLLKFTAISTTEDLVDSNGTNLASQTIQWNDSTNSNWYEQFIKVLNSSLPVNGVFGKPNKSETVAGISTDQYRVNGVNTDVPVFAFEKPIEGKSTPFEIVSTDIEEGEPLIMLSSFDGAESFRSSKKIDTVVTFSSQVFSSKSVQEQKIFAGNSSNILTWFQYLGKEDWKTMEPSMSSYYEQRKRLVLGHDKPAGFDQSKLWVYDMHYAKVVL